MNTETFCRFDPSVIAQALEDIARSRNFSKIARQWRFRQIARGAR